MTAAYNIQQHTAAACQLHATLPASGGQVGLNLLPHILNRRLLDCLAHPRIEVVRSGELQRAPIGFARLLLSAGSLLLGISAAEQG